MLSRRLIVIAVALLLSVQVVRNAVVADLAEVRPDQAAKFWAGHPAVEISRALAQIGAASRAQRPIDSSTFGLINDAASKSPMAPQPFLVRGVQAQLGGDWTTARNAFEAAQRRDPRSLAAAYFLAGYDLRTGNAAEGLQQVALLARLSPQGAETAAPYLATYAREPANWSAMRSLFRSQPGLEPTVLMTLAQDPANADALMAVASTGQRKPDSPWVSRLLSALVSAGEYDRARAIWATIGRGGNKRTLLFDPGFASPAPPPPFNWSFAGSTVGLAERQPGNRLHVIFYGNDDGVLASQLVTLPPGAYRLRLRLVDSAVHPEALRWSLRCDKAQEPVSLASLPDVASNGWTFEVPANCAAQWLELSGRAGDVAQQSEATVTGLSLVRSGADG